MISLAGSGHIIVFEFSLTSIANKTHESLRLMKFQNLTNVSGYQLLNFYFIFIFGKIYKKKKISAYFLEQKFIFSEFWFRRVHIGGSDD